MDEASLKKEALAILRGFSEDDLRKEIIHPFFEHQGWDVEDIDSKDEIHHDCDLLLKGQLNGEWMLLGVQLKARENISTVAHAKEVRQCAQNALDYDFGDGYITGYRWITTGKITSIGRNRIGKEIAAKGLIKKITAWDVEDLYRELLDSGVMHKIGALRIVDAKLKAELHTKNNEGIFAAYYCHRVGRWHLTHKDGDHVAAREAFKLATVLVEGDPHKSLYYHRTLLRYSEMWMQLADRWQELAPGPDDHLVDIAESPGAKAILTERYPEGLIPLLRDAESVFQQLEILHELQLVRYASLELLHITRLLLRAGYPPSLPGMEERIGYIARELEKENWCSIDKECSLCTSYAVSCYALANRRDEVAAAVQWLKTLGEDRYVHLKSFTRPTGEHSLHYAAAVLLALLDYGEGEDAIEEVLGVFFQSREKDRYGFYREWMKYRSEDRFWVSRHIFNAFLLRALAGRDLKDGRASALREALEALIVSVEEEANEVQSRFFYPIRENLGSFSLGLILRSKESRRMTQEVVHVLRGRAAETVRSEKIDRQELWDSSLDRTPVLIEGLLQYWETVIYLEEQGRDLTESLVDTEAPCQETF